MRRRSKSSLEKKRTRKELEYNKALGLVFAGVGALWFRIEGENYRSYPDAMLLVRNNFSYWELKSENNSIEPKQKKRLMWLSKRGHRCFILRKHSKYIKITHLTYSPDKNAYNKNYHARIFRYKPDTPIAIIMNIMIGATLSNILAPKVFEGGMYNYDYGEDDSEE